MSWDTTPLLHEVWQRNLPLFRQRMQVLSELAASASAGDVTAEQRSDGEGIAHQLAGSLGMFGLPEGTRLARELESLLADAGPLDATRCGLLIAKLHVVMNV